MEVEVVPNNTCGHRILQTKPFLLINLEAAGGGVVAAANDRRQQQAYSGWCSPIQSIFAAESLTINDYKQLITQDGGLPCLYPTVEIRRMEGGQRQDGGAWGRTEEEGSRQIFNFSQQDVQVSLCAVDWQPSQGYDQSLEGSPVLERESFVI